MQHLQREQHRRLATLFTVLADAVFYYLLSTLLIVGINSLDLPNSGSAQMIPLPPWFFPSALGLVLGLNLWLRQTQRRLAGILFVNLLFYGILGFLALCLMRDTLSLAIIHQVIPLLSGQAGLANLVQVWLMLILLAIALIRTYQKSGQDLHPAEALTHFELSIATLFGLALLYSLLQIPLAGGIPWLLAGFLAQGAALSLAPSRALPQKPLWLGPSVLVILLLPIAGLSPLILPFLASPAEVILETSRPVLAFILEGFLAVLIWVFRRGHMIPQASSAPDSTSPSESLAEASSFTPSSWMNQMGLFLLESAGILLALGILLLISYLVYRFLRILFRLRDPGPNWTSAERSEPGWKVLLNLLASWLHLLKTTLAWSIAPSWRTKAGIRESYQTLQRWGKQHHLPREPYETPHEYLARLRQHFPSKTDSLNLITDAYVRHTYGNPNSFEPRLSDLLRALQNLYGR